MATNECSGDFDNLFRAILERVGIQINDNQTADLERLICNLLKSFRNPDHLQLALARESLDAPLWQEILQVITIGETYFFRNQDQFNALRTSVLPAIIDRRRAANYRQIRLWSAGCATGEEIYSLAMLLRELIPDISTWTIHLLGTDINAASLERARQGTYRNWSFRNETPDYLRERWFTRHGDNFQIDPSIRDMVTFDLLNLVSDEYPSADTRTEQLDLIVFRNVSIYFDQATTAAIIKRMQTALTVDGWLLVGHAEPLASIYQGFTPHNFPNAVLYQNAAAPVRVEPLPAALLPLPRPEAPRPRLTPTPALHVAPPEKTIQQLLQQAKHAADHENWHQALKLLDAAKRQNTFLPDVYYLHALVQIHLGDLDDAMTSLRRTIYCDNKFALAFYTLGEIQEKRKAFKEAIKTWKLAQLAVADMNSQDRISFSEDITVEMFLGLLSHQISRVQSLISRSER